MGEIEEIARKKRSNRNIREIILKCIAVPGVLSVALLAPNTFKAMYKLGLLPGIRDSEIIKRSRTKLIEKGLIEYENGMLRITPKGQAELRRVELDQFSNDRHKRWDGQWRVLIFDVSEKRKGLRDKIRNTLIAIGFTRLQDSVWIYPYDCEEFVTLLKADFKIGKEVLYMIVDVLENDVWIKKHFNLPT